MWYVIKTMMQSMIKNMGEQATTCLPHKRKLFIIMDFRSVKGISRVHRVFWHKFITDRPIVRMTRSELVEGLCIIILVLFSCLVEVPSLTWGSSWSMSCTKGWLFQSIPDLAMVSGVFFFFLFFAFLASASNSIFLRSWCWYVAVSIHLQETVQHTRKYQHRWTVTHVINQNCVDARWQVYKCWRVIS